MLVLAASHREDDQYYKLYTCSMHLLWQVSSPCSCKLRSMESLIRLFWVHRSCSPALALMLVFFNLLVLAFTLGAPTQNYISSSAIPPLAVTTTVITDLYPTTVDEDTGDGFLHEPPTSGYDPTAPRPLPFLKVTSTSCTLTLHAITIQYNYVYTLS